MYKQDQNRLEKKTYCKHEVKLLSSFKYIYKNKLAEYKICFQNVKMCIKGIIKKKQKKEERKVA